ncbi:MAG TPA: GNAT family N-acetyltransferase [Burkholderiales bacterium]|nr:GNAT family N-acetyltransferase [Burkholderiales bacterium]
MKPNVYRASEILRDGRRLEVRALEPQDRDALVAAAGRSSAETLALRFFSPKRGFTEKEIEYYTKVDFVNHVALAAVVDEAGKPLIVGGGRYIVAQPGCAEVAFTVEDAHQGRGIASLLLRHLVKIARAAGLKELFAEVLPDNAPMLKVFERSGIPMARKRGRDAVHVTLRLD